MNAYLKFSTLAIQMAVIIGVLTYVGHKVDIKYNSQVPVFTIIGSLMGIGISFYFIFKELKNLK